MKGPLLLTAGAVVSASERAVRVYDLFIELTHSCGSKGLILSPAEG
jgi:hypothetical protein